MRALMHGMRPGWFRNYLRSRGLVRAALFDELLEKASDAARFFIAPDDWRLAEGYLSTADFYALARSRYSSGWMHERSAEAAALFAIAPRRFPDTDNFYTKKSP